MPEPISAPNSSRRCAQANGADHRAASHSREREHCTSSDTGTPVRPPGPFLRWCLAKAIPDAKQPITQVRLERFLIGAQPDLSGCKLEVRVVFAGCRFTAPVDLTGAEIAGIAFVASDVPRILADRAMMKGSLLIRTDADVPGHLR